MAHVLNSLKYSDVCESIRHVVGHGNVLILLYEDLEYDKRLFYTEFFNFLGIEFDGNIFWKQEAINPTTRKEIDFIKLTKKWKLFNDRLLDTLRDNDTNNSEKLKHLIEQLFRAIIGLTKYSKSIFIPKHRFVKLTSAIHSYYNDDLNGFDGKLKTRLLKYSYFGNN